MLTFMAWNTLFHIGYKICMRLLLVMWHNWMITVSNKMNHLLSLLSVVWQNSDSLTTGWVQGFRSAFVELLWWNCVAAHAAKLWTIRMISSGQHVLNVISSWNGSIQRDRYTFGFPLVLDTVIKLLWIKASLIYNKSSTYPGTIRTLQRNTVARINNDFNDYYLKTKQLVPF